jgi:hypothetical protein
LVLFSVAYRASLPIPGIRRGVAAARIAERWESIETLEDGDLLFHAGSISVVVPAELMRPLPSQDNDTHICIYQIGSGEYRLRCVFVPGIT